MFVRFLDVTINDVCPLCDRSLAPREPKYFQGLPTTTDQVLVELYRRIWPHTSPSSREGNGNGRSVLLDGSRNSSYEILRQVCTQHRYESFCLPMSLELQFPRSADFEKVAERMITEPMKSILLSIFESPWLSCAFPQKLKLRPSYRAATLASRLRRKEEVICSG